MSMVWGDAERAQLAAHVRALPAPIAADRADQIVRQLDTYRVSWLAARVDAWVCDDLLRDETRPFRGSQ
jgi:hypothetical protein